MASNEAIPTYIKKLCHPVKEIRERSLQLLLAKSRLGWELHDELATTRELLEVLLAWFQEHQPTLQREALELLLTTVKTKSGTYIAKEFGIEQIISSLNKIRHKIGQDSMELFEDVLETLRFLNTVQSEENVNIPRLLLSETSSDAVNSSNDYYNLGSNRDSSKETSIHNEERDQPSCEGSNSLDGISVLLFPWVELSTSDLKTLTLVEDSLKLLKSTRRCCRFIRDVFLRDFPVEIFLNRPTIVKTLLTIADRQHGGHPSEALQVLLSITRLLRKRLIQLFSLDLITNSNKISDEHEGFDKSMDAELEHLRSEKGYTIPFHGEDNLAILRQLPAPIFALDTAHAILSTMARSVVLVEPGVKTEAMDMKELNICLNLVECLINLLMDCVKGSFWSADHSTRTQRDIAHKSCMVMRTIGDLLAKYRKSFNDDVERVHHRLAWLRLVCSGARLLRWARRSALPPAALVTALQAAQLDPALDLLYPELANIVSTALLTAKASVDQEYKSKYRELTKLFSSMVYAVQFMKKKDSAYTKNVLTCIKNSLPVLQLHQSEAYLKQISDILLLKSKSFDFDEKDWSDARSIALNLMAHSTEWVRVTFYNMMLDMVKSVLIGDDEDQIEREKCLALICDVSILSEICCHGLSSNNKEVESSSSQIMLYLLRGRMVLSESCWWRLLASLMPVFPLLHVYAAHDTHLGKAICKSLESDIVECMGVSTSEMVAGLVRLLFVNCPAVQLDAAHALCRLIDDERYLPPREAIRTDILMNALRRLEPEEFNVDANSSPSRTTQTTGLTQILEVLKQDVILDEEPSEVSYDRRMIQPALEPSLRRSTLQQLAVMMRQQDVHTAFLQNDGLRLIVAILRMSLTVDDYLAFPECAVSCVSVLNSVCFTSRHSLAKIPDLPLLLVRVILVFPANESCTLMSAQVLAMVAWSGFVLQELDSTRHRIPALPWSVTQRTSLPFRTNSYWNTSPNAEHSFVEWLLSEEMWRTAVRVRWWWEYAGGAKALRASTFTPLSSVPSICSPTEHDILALRAACVATSCTKALLALENATSHAQVMEALCLLESYTSLVPLSSISNKEFGSLPWQHTRRFLCSPPASSRDTALLITMLQFIITYMDNVPKEDGTMSWIKTSFIGRDAVIIALLSKERLFPQQTSQEDIEMTQLHIHIVKILLRCVILLEHDDGYDSNRMESLLKILLACLESVDLKNFHMLGYLNELMRCVRYVYHCRYCEVSEAGAARGLAAAGGALAGSAGGAGRRGQACRLDAALALLALLRHARAADVPVQRWSEYWSSDVFRALAGCMAGERAELRGAALLAAAALALHSQMLPQLAQAIPRESISRYALEIFCNPEEANVVRAAAATLLTAVTARTSPHSQVLEREVLQEITETNFVEHCLHIFVDFCNRKESIEYLEPNVPLSLLERRSELEVRAQKSERLTVSPRLALARPPPTPALVAAVADSLHNINAFKSCPVQMWNEQGLYRVIFRCASWSTDSSVVYNPVRTAACRALAAACTHKCVRTSLATTKDCLYNLLMTLTPLEDDDAEGITARTQALFLLAALLPERDAGDCVWWELKKTSSVPFFHLLLQALHSEDNELQEAALHCLTQLSQSTAHRKHADKSKDTSCVKFLEDLKSPSYREECPRFIAGDGGAGSDCRPEYMVEDVCKALMHLYSRFSENKRHLSSQDDSWILVCSCLSSVLSISPRARLYAVHRQFPTILLATMQAVRDKLSLQGKPADVIKNANHDPALHTLYWLLTLMNCLMLECTPAKESFADSSMAASLVRLWPWCMMTEQLRYAIMHLLVTFTNKCAKAWSSMCTCVGGRSVVGEVCALLVREAARARPGALLRPALRVLAACTPHHHCRSIILKSEVILSACRVRAGAASRGAGALLAAAARHADGAAALLAARAPRPLPALANAAHHCRTAFLQSPELLEQLSGSLLTGDTGEIVHAARAVWALAANNHRAKLVMRSAGITTAVHSTMQRLSRHPDQASRRALELLTYTHTVLQAT
ncbi:rotatin-like [Epargyreus clarus]|uniref:rotatin-like n=1 Tax=Epargyreus clarus TaxID=520877 RepID=UPI003C2F4AFD